MTYDFALDKKGVISVLAGWIIMAVLLFGAGLIVGTYWNSSGSTTSAAASRRSLRNSRDVASIPKEPVLRSTEPSEEDVAAAENDTGSEEPEESEASASAASKPGTAAQSPEAAQDQAADQQTTEEQTATAPPVDTPGKANQEARTGAATTSVTGAGAIGDAQIFTVQVGVFLEQNEASRLLKQMERRGYAPSFFADRDAENRQWYAIRIGAYSDKDQAANAAANFTKQEKIKAVVRPLGSL